MGFELVTFRGADIENKSRLPSYKREIAVNESRDVGSSAPGPLTPPSFLMAEDCQSRGIVQPSGAGLHQPSLHTTVGNLTCISFLGPPSCIATTLGPPPTGLEVSPRVDHTALALGFILL